MSDAFAATRRAHASFFAGGAPVLVARAPGRLDLMGGIADYSGALVLQLPLEAATYVAAQADAAPIATARSVGVGELAVPLDALESLGTRHDARWAAYALGALVVLSRARGWRPPHGVRLLIESTVPPGKGVSSSAALEVAAMRAICAVYDLALDGRELALLCQRVENEVVGAPCGVMDQMTSACGEANRLLALRCQPAEIVGHVALPAELAVWGIDSGIRHAVTGADYGAVRTGAFMGYRIVADVAGLPLRHLGNGRVAIDDARWGGYLANVTPSEWASALRDRVPEAMTGAEFLARYGGTTDSATRVDPDRTYAVRAPTAHPIHEHHRVRTFRMLLGAAPSDEQRALLGEAMYQSHASYSDCGLGSDGTDRLVALVREAQRTDAPLYGAKITGGGSGGTVAVLGARGADDVVERIARRYADETGREATVLGGSSPGAMAYGVETVAG